MEFFSVPGLGKRYWFEIEGMPKRLCVFRENRVDIMVGMVGDNVASMDDGSFQHNIDEDGVNFCIFHRVLD